MKKQCPKCQSSMSEGLMIENKDGIPTSTRWVEGPLEKGWFGLKLKGRRQITVATHRCTRCGYLENYAPG